MDYRAVDSIGAVCGVGIDVVHQRHAVVRQEETTRVPARAIDCMSRAGTPLFFGEINFQRIPSIGERIVNVCQPLIHFHEAIGVFERFVQIE